MYHAKRSGKNTFRVYDDEMNSLEAEADSKQKDAPYYQRQYRD